MEARRIAFEILMTVITEDAYSNEALAGALAEKELPAADKALVRELVYGTLTHYKLLKYWLKPYFQGRVKEWVKVLLAMTLYQTTYLEKIPHYAAVDEAVKLAHARGGDFNAKTVNAVLRNVLAQDLRSFDEMEEGANRLAVETSHPTWLVRLWEAQFGLPRTVAMLKANNARPPLMLRTNITQISKAQLKARLEREGVKLSDAALVSTALTVEAGNPVATESFEQGLFYIQDEASMLVALALSPAKGAAVLDVCAAPGGKSFHLAEQVGADGVVYAHDVSPYKIARIKENAERLKVANVKPKLGDAHALDQFYERESFDYILVDAPCSGLGIVRRHPEAKMRKRPEQLDEIVQVQKEILAHAAAFLKPGGRLVYSTCTVNRKENHRQIEGFLNENQNFSFDEGFEARMPAALNGHFEDGMLQLFPQDFNTDGFFIAAIVKDK